MDVIVAKLLGKGWDEENVRRICSAASWSEATWLVTFLAQELQTRTAADLLPLVAEAKRVLWLRGNAGGQAQMKAYLNSVGLKGLMLEEKMAIVTIGWILDATNIALETYSPVAKAA